MTPTKLTPDGIAAGPMPSADEDAQHEAETFAKGQSTPSSPSQATKTSRREELHSDLIQQQKDLRLTAAAATVAVTIILFTLFFCSAIEINRHIAEIKSNATTELNQFMLWFLSILALPPTLLLIVLLKGVFAAKEEKNEAKLDTLPGPLVIKLIQEIIKPH